MTFMYFKDSKGVVREVLAYIRPSKEEEGTTTVRIPYGVAVMSDKDLADGFYKKVSGRNRAAARCRSAENLYTERGVGCYSFLPYRGVAAASNPTIDIIRQFSFGMFGIHHNIILSRDFLIC